MKNVTAIKPIFILFNILLLSGLLYSQSDYQIVQQFKDALIEIEESINSAKSINELNSIVADIDRLRSEYTTHKNLLDKSLYPDNFEKAFDRLDLAFIIRSQDFTTIDILQTENLQLKEQVTVLNKRNSELMNRIQDIELSVKKDNSKANELKILVAELKNSLNKRDELIFGIVDSLMPKLMAEQTGLSKEDQSEIYIQSEKNDLITNIKKSLQENIRFIYITSLSPEDLNDIEKRQNEFSDFWQDVGVKLVDVYAANENKSREISDIDSLYNKWSDAIQRSAWINIRQEFAYNHIILIEFYNSNQFTEVITSYIDDEIRNIGVKSDYETEQKYYLFVDSTWNKKISDNWIPFLMEKYILSIEQKGKIETKIMEWESRLTPKSYDWIYAIVIIAAVAGIIFMNRKRIFKSRNKSV
jgi:hypothetical protein